MINETKINKNKNLNTMHNIVMTLSWLFPHAKYKGTSPFSPFTLTSTPLLTFS